MTPCSDAFGTSDTLAIMVTALTCPMCGAPLPRLTAGQPFAACAYCGATASLTGTSAQRAEASTRAPAESAANPDLSLRTIEAFERARQRGATSFGALEAAARERLGPMGETDAFARVVLALGIDFDAENGTEVVEDAKCMGRLIEAYLTAIEKVRANGAYDANLPFFTATAQGPKHYARTLTADVIASLAAREPVVKPKQKRFWLFG